MTKEQAAKVINALLRHEITKEVAITQLSEKTPQKPKEPPQAPKYSPEVYTAYEHILKLFDEHLRPKTEAVTNNWLKTLHQLETIERLPLREVYKIVKWARESDFWAKNFLSLVKLRQKNKAGVMYIIVFNESKKNEQKKPNNQNRDLAELSELSKARELKANQG